jgi:hypothetical protein
MTMKNVFELLKQKEQELQEIQKQLDALRIVCGLLTQEDGRRDSAPAVSPAVHTATAPINMPPQFPSLPPRVPQVAAKPQDVFASSDPAPRQFP